MDMNTNKPCLLPFLSADSQNRQPQMKFSEKVQKENLMIQQKKLFWKSSKAPTQHLLSSAQLPEIYNQQYFSVDLNLWWFLNELKIKWPQTQRTLGCWWQCWAEIWRPTRLASQACKGNIWIKKHDFFVTSGALWSKSTPWRHLFYIPCFNIETFGSLWQNKSIWWNILQYRRSTCPLQFIFAFDVKDAFDLPGRQCRPDMMQMVQMISTGHDCHRSGMMLVRALSRSNEMTTTQ